jgi:DNA repair exonuclease SbcCD ATPase subunit
VDGRFSPEELGKLVEPYQALLAQCENVKRRLASFEVPRKTVAIESEEQLEKHINDLARVSKEEAATRQQLNELQKQLQAARDQLVRALPLGETWFKALTSKGPYAVAKRLNRGYEEILIAEWSDNLPDLKPQI